MLTFMISLTASVTVYHKPILTVVLCFGNLTIILPLTIVVYHMFRALSSKEKEYLRIFSNFPIFCILRFCRNRAKVSK